jgi:hypothetical protein
MANAAVTYVYNEAVNLPIWLSYYGKQFGHENLFVIDRRSDDGSTDDLGAVNVIKIPRTEFDENAKTNTMSSFHAALTSSYDCVILTDGDEIIVPDPAHFADLNDYIARLDGDYVNAIGVDVTHILSQELPLDLTRPVMSQRRFGRFHSPECKNLLSRVPVRWLPGLHSSNKPPVFDPHLINFHLKLMDYGCAMARQSTNLSTPWSAHSLERHYGAHHRWPHAQFVHQSFFVPMDLINRSQIFDFEFSKEIDLILQGTTVDAQQNHHIPMNISKMVHIPERFQTCF